MGTQEFKTMPSNDVVMSTSVLLKTLYYLDRPLMGEIDSYSLSTQRLGHSCLMMSTKMEKSIKPWINSILITSFDEKKGPQIDYEYPQLLLPESVKNEIKISSLPKTCSDSENQCFFVIRIRVDKDATYSIQACDSHDFLYGYIYFQ